MESAGVYWIPVWNALEHPPGKLDLVLLNPQHVKALPGDYEEYREQGADYFDRLHPERTRNRLTARLQNLGFDAQLTPRILPQSS
jgi:hypothetical protein